MIWQCLACREMFHQERQWGYGTRLADLYPDLHWDWNGWSLSDRRLIFREWAKDARCHHAFPGVVPAEGSRIWPGDYVGASTHVVEHPRTPPGRRGGVLAPDG